MTQHSYHGLLGKKPARESRAPAVHFGDVATLSKLPPVPAGDFGHERLIRVWPDLGNDDMGDCVIAGGLAEHLLWTTENGHPALVNKATAVANYEVFGYDPAQTDARGNNPTDQGVDMVAAADYRIKTGLVDAHGVHHKIGAYLALEPGNLDQLWQALYLFDGVGIGLLFPDEWMAAVERGQVWDRIANPTVNENDGHYVTALGRINGNIGVVSFAMLCQMTPAGYQEFADIVLAYLTQERVNYLQGKVDLEGLDMHQLTEALQLVGDLGAPQHLDG